MKFNLLIIDDELDEPARSGTMPRREYYNCLADKFELIFLDHIKNLQEALRSSPISAVLLDFVLAKWGTEAAAVLQMLEGHYPVALISSHWGPNFEKLRITLGTHKEVAQLFTWEDLEEEERRGLVAIWLDSAIRKSKNITTSQLGPSDSIRILQLSDLQFGKDLPSAFASESQTAAQLIRRRWGGPPHFIALTGDIAEAGMPTEYDQAHDWITEFARKLDPSWDPHRFLVIPGNHDICWPIGLSSRIDIKSKAISASEINSELKPFAMEPFRRFASRLGGEFSWAADRQYSTCGRYRQLGVLFFGYNTCEELDEWGLPTRNIVDLSVSKMFGELLKFEEESTGGLLIGLIHHPIVADNPSETIKNQNVLFKNISGNWRSVVLLSGHVHGEACTLHTREGVSALEVTASTTTKPEKDRPADTARGFTLIELGRENGRVNEVKVEYFKFDRRRIVEGGIERYSRDGAGRLHST